eukprot:9019884-Alexandrium_andersonii.AAC.1
MAAACAAGPGGRYFCLASVYLPCGATAADLQDFHELPQWEGTWVVAGDLNVDLGEPRNERAVE